MAKGIFGKRSEGQKLRADAVLIVGLGRFGGAIAATLTRLGHEVLAVDTDEARVSEWAEKLTHVVRADSTNELTMRQLGAQEFDIAVVAIGSDVEASLLSTAVLVELGVRRVWAKAITAPHGSILDRIGAEHVVYPEWDAGRRTARLLTEKLLDFLEFEDHYAIAKMRAPAEAFGKALGESHLRTKYGITVVGVKRQGEDFTHAQADTVIQQGDLLVVSGQTEAIERFAAEAS